MKIKRLHLISKDKRGIISLIIDLNNKIKIKSVLLIKSKAGAVRANHYHKKDVHYTYLLSGEFEYFEKKTDKESDKFQSILIKPDEIVETSKGVIHAMKFLMDSIMIVFTTEDRDPVSYEKDTVRIKII